MVRRKNEETLWTAWSRDGGGFHRVSQAGRLRRPDRPAALRPQPGGQALRPRRVRRRSRARRRRRLDTQRQADIGLDAKWEVRPGLVLDGTVHPDFAQVEADDEQVNLTRFDLFFPEKRDFFLENAGIFDFGWRGLDETPPFLLFFSRRIGIAKDDESPIPVRGGVRLSGRVGRQTVGFLDVLTGAGRRPALRQLRRPAREARPRQSNYVGAMLVDRRDDGRAATRRAGLDASFWPDGRASTSRPSPRAPGPRAGRRRRGLAGERRLHRRSRRLRRPAPRGRARTWIRRSGS